MRSGLGNMFQTISGGNNTQDQQAVSAEIWQAGHGALQEPHNNPFNQLESAPAITKVRVDQLVILLI